MKRDALSRFLPDARQALALLYQPRERFGKFWH
jgi:hypothetical protein